MLTREEAKRRAELYSALADGKTIQVLNPKNSIWTDMEIDCVECFPEGLNYRIKSDPKYRPFKNQEECWLEMHKHPDFGWLVNKNSKSIYHINVICCDDLCLDETPLNFVEAFTYYEFLDGSHFGIKEEQK